WGVQLWNRYMQSLDYRHHRVSLNREQVALEPDGSFRVVVAQRDPGVPNWIETAGHREGLVFCRWLQADTLPEQATATVMRLRGRQSTASGAISKRSWYAAYRPRSVAASRPASARRYLCPPCLSFGLAARKPRIRVSACGDSSRPKC